MRIAPDTIQHETRICWEEAPGQYEYVRQRLETCGTRQRGVPLNGPGRRIGYAVLSEDAPGVPGRKGTFLRRVFFLKSYDRAEIESSPYEESAPWEAVDPSTIGPGEMGKLTGTAWGRELGTGESDLQL